MIASYDIHTSAQWQYHSQCFGLRLKERKILDLLRNWWTVSCLLISIKTIGNAVRRMTKMPLIPFKANRTNIKNHQTQTNVVIARRRTFQTKSKSIIRYYMCFLVTWMQIQFNFDWQLTQKAVQTTAEWYKRWKLNAKIKMRPHCVNIGLQYLLIWCKIAHQLSTVNHCLRINLHVWLFTFLDNK